MSIEIKRSDKYVDYNISATNNRGYITIDTSDWINKPWMFYELPALKFEIYTESGEELVKYQNFSREIRTYNPVYSPLGVLNVTIDIRNVPEEFILRITPIFDNDAVAARNMLIENGIEDGDIWGSDQDVPTQLFNLDLEFIECTGEYIPPIQPTHEETVTFTEPPYTFDDSDGSPIISFTIKGNGQQTGTPTPDNPVMPDFCGVRTGNLAPPTWASDFISRVTPQPGFVPHIHDDYLLVYARNGYGNYDTEYLFTTEWKQNTQYTFCLTYLRESNQNTDSMLAAVYTDETNEYFPDTVNDGEWHTIYVTTTANKTIKYLRIRYSSGSLKIKIDNFYVYEGIEQKPYEPFGLAIPISCAGQTIPVYLGEVPTVRRVKKLVLDGTESYSRQGSGTLYSTVVTKNAVARDKVICSHLPYSSSYAAQISVSFYSDLRNLFLNFGTDIMDAQPSGNTVDGLKEYLAAQYAAGTPVTVWYVLASPETAIVNEPLAKIGDYADELNSEDAGVTIPTVKGQNTLTVDTDLQPSEMTITYIKEGQ